MLAITRYSPAYVEVCRRKIEAEITAYRDLMKVVTGSGTRLQPTLDAFDQQFFRSMLLALDHYFDHRMRGQELKDGNALNELRVLCNSIMHNDGQLMGDTQIKLDPAKSILHLHVGDDILLTADQFSTLAAAVFEQILIKYP
jgi:hypothetical protein